MKVLILSSPADDPHAASVSKHLTELKVEHDFFRFEEFIQQCQISYEIQNNHSLCKIEKVSNQNLTLQSYGGIWHRRPGKLVAGNFPEPWIARMVESEARAALEGMLFTLDCVWVNYPPNDSICLHKLIQLNLAAQAGLSIPDTLVTNKADLVQEFFDQCNGQVIYKPISESSNFAIPAYENPRGISTLPLRRSDLRFLSQVTHSPHLFQKAIPKSCELRVTVVGHKIFCISIDSQSGGGKVDWRNDYSVDMKPYVLPEGISNKCITLMRKLGLNYGALDFILTPEGEYVFLEINCAGQYMWIEQRTDMEISLEVAKLLCGVAPPLVRHATKTGEAMVNGSFS